MLAELLTFGVSRTPSVLEPKMLSELEHPSVTAGLDIWTHLCGSTQMPAKRDIQPRDFGRHLQNISLVKIIDGGRNFELRIVGDAVARRFRMPLQGAKLSTLFALMPAEAALVRAQYAAVMTTRQPCAWQIHVGDDLHQSRFSAAEFVRLPLSDDGEAVDHILTFVGFLNPNKL